MKSPEEKSKWKKISKGIKIEVLLFFQKRVNAHPHVSIVFLFKILFRS